MGNVGLPVIPCANIPVKFADDRFAPARLTSVNSALDRLAVVSAASANEKFASSRFIKFAVLRFAAGPNK